MIFKSNEEMITLLKQIFGDKMKTLPMFIICALVDIKNNSSKKLKAGVAKEDVLLFSMPENLLFLIIINNYLFLFKN